MEINVIPYEVAKGILLDATIENPIIQIDYKCKFYGVKYDNKIVCIAGVMTMNNKVRIKNNYTLPEYRREGFFTEMLYYLMNKYDCKIDAYCTEASKGIYLNEGFNLKKKYERKYQDIYWVERG